jgi:hypothetical protein
MEANHTFIAVIPLTEKSEKIAPADSLVKQMGGSAARFFNNYHLLHFPGEISGYIIETGEKEEFGNLENFQAFLKKKTKINFSKHSENPEVDYLSISGEKLRMKYIPEKLRCKAVINGKKINWDNFTGNAVYESPFLKVKNGKMEISNGMQGYSVKFENGVPVWEKIKE